MIWTRTKAAARNAWTAYKTPIIVVGLILAIVLGVYFKNQIGAGIRHVKNWVFHSQVDALQGENRGLQIQLEKTRGERDAALNQVKTVELERDGLKLQYEAFGELGKAAVRAQEQVNKEYEAKTQSINNTVSAYDNCVNLWTARRDTGYPIGQSKDRFCARFVGR